MKKSAEKKKIVEINEQEIKDHLGEMVKNTVEDTLNRMQDAEAEAICNAEKFEHSPDWLDTRAEYYDRKLETKAGTLNLKVPKLCKLPFETAKIQRYQ